MNGTKKTLLFVVLIISGLTITTNNFFVSAGSPLFVFFVDSGQLLGDAFSNDVDVGDLDGDGDADAFVANFDANTVWLNDGDGLFVESAQPIGSANSQTIALGDLDKDGDLDAFVGNRSYYAGAPDQVWLNDGDGQFDVSAQSLAEQVSSEVVLGDVDKDDDLDAFVAACGPGFLSTDQNILWLNDGNANFSQSGQDFGVLCSSSVQIGDVNQDNYPDLVVGNAGSSSGIEIWLNDNQGTGVFTKTQVLNRRYNFGLDLGDIDGDDDLDIFVANGEALGDAAPNTAWLNDGTGTFTDSGQRLGSAASQDISLSDLDGDDDLDAVVANGSSSQPQPNKVWINTGSGTFVTTSQDLGSAVSNSLAIDDLDSDGDFELFVANQGANTVWFILGESPYKLYFPLVSHS